MDLSFQIIELAGVALFAASGALLAVQNRMDLFGVLILGVVTALGGGLIRDVLIGQNPPVMFTYPAYIYLSVVASLSVFVVVRLTHKMHRKNQGIQEFLFILSDAMGLGVYAMIGVQAGMDAGYMGNMFLCVCMGTITCVGGGVIRDVMCLSIPTVLWDHIYALAATLGSAAYYIGICLGIGETISTLLAVIFTVAARVLSWHYHWSLPRIPLEDIM